MKELGLLSVFMLFSLRGMSCDACGGSLGGAYFGLLPENANSFVGLRYSTAFFNASMIYNSEFLTDEYSDDTFRKLELFGRYAINDRMQVSFIAPYLMNKMDGTEQYVESNGLGDPSVLIQYNLLKGQADIKNLLSHSLTIGAGLKFPVGDFNQLDEGQVINTNFQLGSGSLDYLFNLNYTAKADQLGLNLDGTWKVNTSNQDDYRFGNQASLSANLFYLVPVKKMILVPMAGVYYERGDYHFEGEIRQLNTGGEALFLSLGGQLRWINVALSGQFFSPLSAEYHTDNIADIQVKNRNNISILYHF